MTKRRRQLWLGVVLMWGVGCATDQHLSGLRTSEERRIWVIRSTTTGDEVYRCADGAGPDQPPKPLCVRAPLGMSP
jgi:hypothetical protein